MVIVCISEDIDSVLEGNKGVCIWALRGDFRMKCESNA